MLDITNYTEELFPRHWGLYLWVSVSIIPILYSEPTSLNQIDNDALIFLVIVLAFSVAKFQTIVTLCNRIKN